MKKLILIGLVALTACAAQPSKEVQELARYRDEMRPQAGTTIKWSAYYEGIYSRLLAAGASGQQLALANDGIRAAKQFEAGALSADEFADFQRQLTAQQVVVRDETAERNAAARARAQAVGAAQMDAATRLIKASN